MACKYCNPNGDHLKTIQDTCILNKVGEEKDKSPFIKVEMQTGGNKLASLRVVSASENKLNQTIFDILFCPMCGQDLKEYISDKI